MRQTCRQWRGVLRLDAPLNPEGRQSHLSRPPGWGPGHGMQTQWGRSGHLLGSPECLLTVSSLDLFPQASCL